MHLEPEPAPAVGDLLRTPSVLHRLSECARPHAQQFSWDRTADGLLAAYATAAADLAGVQA